VRITNQITDPISHFQRSLLPQSIVGRVSKETLLPSGIKFIQNNMFRLNLGVPFFHLFQVLGSCLLVRTIDVGLYVMCANVMTKL
jgi:hypothetical protein